MVNLEHASNLLCAQLGWEGALVPDMLHPAIFQSTGGYERYAWFGSLCACMSVCQRSRSSSLQRALRTKVRKGLGLGLEHYRFSIRALTRAPLSAQRVSRRPHLRDDGAVVGLRTGRRSSIDAVRAEAEEGRGRRIWHVRCVCRVERSVLARSGPICHRPLRGRHHFRFRWARGASSALGAVLRRTMCAQRLRVERF
jgi:hypothetical protein